MNQEAYDRETAEIKRLEAIPTIGMNRQEYLIHYTKIKDAYWRRRMAMRTDDEIKRGVVAP
jgi:hypothetical protein